MGPKIGAGGSRFQPAGTFFRAEGLVRVPYQVDGPGQLLPVDDDFDLVPFQQLADRAAGQGFGGDVSDAGSGGDSAEAGVGEQGYVLARRAAT